jgi:hypothetical protein
MSLNVLYDQLQARSINFSLSAMRLSQSSIWRMTIFQHLVEHAIGIMPTLVSAFCIFIINQGINNDLALRVVPKKKTILLKELSSKPVFVFFSPSALPCRYSTRTGSCGINAELLLTLFSIPGIWLLNIK